MIVAAYRVERQMEAVLAEHREQEFEKKQAQAKAEQMSKGFFG